MQNGSATGNDQASHIFRMMIVLGLRDLPLTQMRDSCKQSGENTEVVTHIDTSIVNLVLTFIVPDSINANANRCML